MREKYIFLVLLSRRNSNSRVGTGYATDKRDVVLIHTLANLCKAPVRALFLSTSSLPSEVAKREARSLYWKVKGTGSGERGGGGRRYLCSRFGDYK